MPPTSLYSGCSVLRWRRTLAKQGTRSKTSGQKWDIIWECDAIRLAFSVSLSVHLCLLIFLLGSHFFFLFFFLPDYLSLKVPPRCLVMTDKAREDLFCVLFFSLSSQQIVRLLINCHFYPLSHFNLRGKCAQQYVFVCVLRPPPKTCAHPHAHMTITSASAKIVSKALLISSREPTSIFFTADNYNFRHTHSDSHLVLDEREEWVLVPLEMKHISW